MFVKPENALDANNVVFHTKGDGKGAEAPPEKARARGDTIGFRFLGESS